MTRCSSCGAAVGEGWERCPSCRGSVATATGAQPGGPASGEVAQAQTATAPAGLAPGAVLLGRYRILELLGRGGMGEVYRAEDQVLRQTVALKLLPAEFSRDPTRRHRFLNEVTVARRVSHPNVCRVHDVAESDGRLLISMEHVDGEDLAVLLRRIGRLAGEKALEIARQVTAGLAAAHAAGVVHRDLKPANVMLDRQGRARLTDFGLAVAGSAAAGDLAGTPAYMAPEQLAGMAGSERTDLYALGLLLYELLTGARAFAGTTLGELRRARETPPIPPSQVASDLPPRVEAVILQCLAHEPQARPESALAVLTALSGNDPLAAALAAGQTPSPSAVAGATATGAIRPAMAWACVAILVVSFGIYLGLGPRISVVNRSRLEPPDVLAARARETLARLGYPGPWGDEAWGFAYDREALRYLVAGRRWEALEAARPPAIVFWYRTAPGLLRPRPGPGRIRADDPPLEPGMVIVEFDPRGRLLQMKARPFQVLPPAGMPQDDLLALAGIDPAGLTPDTYPPPPVWADTARAWRAVVGGETLRIEAASLGGRAVHFAIRGPWNAPLQQTTLASARWLRGNDALNLLEVLALIASLLLAADNLRRGRGDRQGALRIAAWIFGLFVAARMLAADHRPTFDWEQALLFASIQQALYLAGSAWLFYVALEPHVRRLWPERLVSWARLAEGRWRDPMVARDVLAGCVVAYASAALVVLTLTSGDTAPLLGVEYGLAPLLGLRHGLAAMGIGAINAVHTGLWSLVLLLVLRLLPIPQRVTSAFMALLLGGAMFGFIRAAEWESLPLSLLLAALFGVSWVVLLTRFGLLAMVTGLFLEFFAALLPNATAVTGWTAGTTWIGLLTLAALSLYGVRYAVGGAPLVRLQLPDR